MSRRFAICVGFLVVAATGMGSLASGASLLNWDPAATGSSAGGGTGTWDTGSWWNGASDVGWVTGDDAAFGGTAGTVTILNGVSANNVIFNTAGYTVTGSSLTLTGGTVAGYSSATISSFLAGTAGLTKTGAGTLDINGSVANGYTGGTTINRGSLLLDFTNMASPTNLIDPGDPLTMGGGILSILGNAGSAAATSQTFSGLAITAGANSILLNSNSGGGTTLALNNIAQTAGSGGTVKFTLAASGSITTTTLDQSGGIIGGWAIIDNGNSTYSWAHSGINAGTTYAISAGTTNTTTGTPAATDNWAPSGNATLSGSVTVNTLIEAHDIHTAGNTLTIGGGGIIFQSNNFWMQDSTGTLTSGLASGELFVHTPNTGLTDTEIRVDITNNGATPVSLIKDGPGTLILQSQNAHSNAYTGNTIINGGALQLRNGFGSAGEIGGSPNIIVNAGGTLQLNAGDVLGYTGGEEALTINSGGTVSNITTASRVTIQNLITMTGGVLTGTGTGDGNGQYSMDNGGAGFLATSDIAGNPSIISARIGPQSGNLLFTVTRGPAAPVSDLNVTGVIQVYGGNGNGIIKAGNGVMTLGAVDTYTGTTTVSAGTLDLAASSGGNGNVPDSVISVGPAGVLGLDNGDVTGYGINLAMNVSGVVDKIVNQSETLNRPITLSGGTMTSSSVTSATGNGAWNFFGGSISTSANTANFITGVGAFSLRTNTAFFNLGANSSLTITVPITQNIGNGNTFSPLNLQGSGLLILTGSNTYTGATNINGGTLQVGNSAALGAGALAFTNTTTAAGLLDLHGYSPSVAILSGSGNIDDLTTTSSTLTVGNGGGSSTFSGQILSTSGAVSLVKAGAGLLNVTNASTYTGSSAITGGTLQIGNASALGASGGALTVSGGVLDINGNSPTLGPVTISSGGIVNSSPAGALTGTSYYATGGLISANLADGGNSPLAVAGGVVTLTGSNGFAGGTTISSGTLNINNDNNLGGPASGITFTGNASLQQASTASVNLGSGRAISINNSVTATIDTQNNAMSIAGPISGSGGLATVSSGALTLSGSNTYSGPTNINNGAIYVNGSLPNSPVTVGPLGSLGGSGTIGMATVSSGGTIDVSPNGPNATLTAGTLNFGNVATLNLGAFANYSSTAPVTAAVNVGSLGLAGPGTVNVTFPGGLVPNGTYNLLSFSSFNNYQDPSLDAFYFANGFGPNGLGGRQTANLQPNGAGNVLQMVVTGDFPIWTGANGTGNVGAWVGQNNWLLYYAGTTTDFQTLDAVQFNDVATTQSGGTTAVTSTIVNISGADVFPTAVVFNNNVLSYTLTGSNAIAGSAVLIMNGSGTVTIDNANSYNGGTTLNAGQLNINNASAIGTGPLTIAGSGVILDNTSGSAVTLSTSTLTTPPAPQFWNSDFTFVGSNNLNLGNGPVTLGSSRIVTVLGGILEVDGNISGPGASLTLAGSGQLVLTASNNYTGGTFLSGGTLTGANDAALGTGPVVLNPSSGTAVLALTSGSPALNSLANSGAGSSYVVLGNVAGSSSTSLTVTIAAANASSTFNGTISDGSATNPLAIGGLTKAGNGTLVLPGITSYTGPTTISGGTLEIGNGTSGELFASPTVSDSGTLAFNHADTLTYPGSVSGAGALAKLGAGLLILTGGSSNYNGGTTISGGTLQVGDGVTTDGSIPATGNVLNNTTLAFAYPAASTFSGVISGSGGVEKSGTGALTLNALQTYTGGTTVNSGTLALNNANGSNGNGLGNILGTLTINPGAEVNILAHDVFGFSGTATGLTTLNINGGVLSQSFTGNETVTGVTINLTAGTMSASVSSGYYDFFTAAGFGTTNVNVLPSTATSVISSAIRLRETPNPIFTVSSGSTAAGVDLLVSGQINQAAAGDGFTKAGPGVMQLSNSNNTYTGVALISAGTLQSASNGALGPGTAGLTVSSGAVLDLYGSSPTVGGLNGAGTVDNSQSGNLTLTVGGGGAGGTFSGTIQNTTGSVSLTKTGAGTQYLSGTNTYTGGTTLSGGSLNFTPGAIPLAANSINFNGGTLQWAASNTQDVSPAIAAIPNGIAAGIDTNGNAVTFGSSLSGSGGLAKIGAGTLSLAVANSFSGSTTINGGTLNVAHPLALQNSTVASSSSGGAVTFATAVTSPTFGALTGNGNINLATATSQAVALNVGNNSQSTTYSGVLSGGGGLIKSGGGLMVLTNNQSYAGATTVSGGTLQLAGGSNIGIKFETGQGGTAHPVTGVAGVVPIGNWQNLPGQTQATPQALNNNVGFPTTAAVTWSGAADNWSVATTDFADQNAQLLNSYLDDSGSTTPAVTVTGIPYSSYNVYVYFTSDGNGRTGSVSIGGTTFDYSTSGNIATPPAFPLILTTDDTGANPGANYAEFSGLSGSSFTLTKTHGSSNSGFGAVEIVGLNGLTSNLLPTSTPLAVAKGATLDLGGVNQQVGSLSDAAPGLGGTITNSGSGAPATLTLGTTGSAIFSGSITDGNSSTGLAMSGSGIQVLAGTNTYSGGTTVASGILVEANTSALPGYSTSLSASNVSVSAGATFAVQAGTLAGEFASSDVDNVRTTANFSAGAKLGISVVSPESFAYKSTITDSTSGALGLVKLGSGTLILSGTNNSYTGGTYDDAGTLVDAADGAIRDGSYLAVGPGATLVFDSTEGPAGSPVVGSSAVSTREIAAVPEPGTIMLLMAALGSAVVYRRFRRRTSILKCEI